ncbi:FAD-dependent oxidoreductase [Selenomonas ruminantium]|uniref:FAD-dependent oxidoreductase n=1 Tax=Selenomonas ruminantium TaxID=971 RepID=UPI00042A80C6|nr:FAD-dependent oxidoreductase [Selenomonas ruminantium]
MQETDILVVGAGAAGASLGYLLKQAGKDVLLLEMLDAKKKNKLCAGIIEHRAEQAFMDIFGKTLDEAGLATMPMEKMLVRHDAYEMSHTMPKNNQSAQGKTQDLARADEKTQGFAANLRNYLKKGGKIAAKMAVKKAAGYEPGVVSYKALPRKRFDDYVLNSYLEAGGRLLDHTTVRSIDKERQVARCVNLVTKKTFEIKYNTLVGADGATSIVRRLLTGKRQSTTLALEAPVPLTLRETVIYLRPVDHGYFWYIPRGKDATVGCVYHKLGCRDSEIRKHFAACCADMGIKMENKIRGALIPDGSDVLLQPAEHCFLIGEAAGLSDNFTGGGIHYALLSAKALADALQGKKTYDEAMKPQLDAVHKNCSNANIYFAAGGKVVEFLGKKKTN